MTRIKHKNLVAYGLVAPYWIHFSIFMAYPLIFSLILVFHKWDVYTPMQFVGLRNFVRLFQDDLFLQSLLNTLLFLLIHIPLQIVAALLFSVLLNEKIRARGFFRAAYFMPVVISGVVISLLWQQLYSQENGVLNLLLAHIGLPKIPWLISPEWAMPSIAIMATWKNVGLYIVLFLAGLQTIPSYLYEAADIDGASVWQKFRSITLPMLNPTVLLVMILSTIGGFSLFIEPYMLTGGGPMNRTLSAMLYIYKQAFYFNRMGYAATLGFFFALLILSVVLVQRKIIEQEPE
ncbi:MAG TPA: sugar ABC transporter permease [bacterium]|nr:sugar ABC transporter permease [bacterium]HPG44895.1 sugar ABC transporter permease [bacterium]HPM98076.1 sugar ABC transporter permease [bacterium]